MTNFWLSGAGGDLREANFEERRTAVLVISCRTRKGVAMKAQVSWNALVVLTKVACVC